MPEETPRKAKRQSPSLKARAVRYLSRREYSRLELEKKLRAYLAEDESEDDLTAVLNDLEQKGYLSDERFAQICRMSVLLKRARECGQLDMETRAWPTS